MASRRPDAQRVAEARSEELERELNEFRVQQARLEASLGGKIDVLKEQIWARMEEAEQKRADADAKAEALVKQFRSVKETCVKLEEENADLMIGMVGDNSEMGSEDLKKA
ncbi:hypothetical protein N0V88_005351 [Collariella sp. IMI 366227]|nr:hypothetical protein N0V88_005351 [Collariella sp. IMI 366227]